MNKIRNISGITMVKAGGNAFFILVGWISAIISVFVYPFVFGVLGVVMGILTSKNRSRIGLPIIVASILLMGVGLIFSGTILHYTRQIFQTLK